MKRRLLCLVLPIITLILEILPYGAVCNFMRPPANEGDPIGHFRELYSYFDLTPFGYANFAPLITAVITCIILLLLIPTHCNQRMQIGQYWSHYWELQYSSDYCS